MEFGIHFSLQGISRIPNLLRYVNELAAGTERLGCTYFTAGEHFENQFDLPAIFCSAAEASGQQKIATSIFLITPRKPIMSARFFAALDVLSNGRVVAGVGPGSTSRDYALVGEPFEEVWPKFDEGVKAMRAYLTPDSTPFKGKYYNTEGVNLDTMPLQDPLPIWIGSWGSDAGLRRVARLADGWLSSAGPGHHTPEQFGKDKARLDEFLVARGKDPATFPNAVSTMSLFISEDRDEIDRVVPPRLQPMRRDAVYIDRPAERAEDSEHAHDMVGTREECIDKVQRWKASGAGALFLNPRGGQHLEQMRIFMEDVVANA